MCAAYQPEQREVFLQFLHSLATLLPCAECQQHFTELISSYPPDPFLGDSEKLFRWSYDIHDAVNKRKGKKTPAYHYIRSFYMKYKSKA
nr:disulfide oxidoreductase [Kaumoebavirus]